MPIAKHQGGVVAGYILAVGQIGDGCSSPGFAHFYAAYPCSGVSSPVINDGTWHQLVGVYDSTILKSTIYVDGQFQSASIGGNVINPISAPFVVGGFGGTPVSQFEGLIDEVRVYDNALTAPQVLALYQPAVSSVPEPGLLALMSMYALVLLGLGWRRRSAIRRVRKTAI